MTTSPYHPDLLILQGTCAGLPANNLVDSGASMTIINHRYMAKYKPPKTKEDPRKTPMGVSRLQTAACAHAVAQGPKLWLRDYMVAVDVGPEACSR